LDDLTGKIPQTTVVCVQTDPGEGNEISAALHPAGSLALRLKGGIAPPWTQDRARACIRSSIASTLACAGPNGSYALTCEGATVKGDTLSARCKKINGQMEETSLKGFQGNINNCDGKLRNGNC
jgi:hypothetical protein